MPAGISGATITTLTNGTTADASNVMASLNSLKSNGVNNDSGTITTNNSGELTVQNLIVAGSSGIGKSSAGDMLNRTGTTTCVRSPSSGFVNIQIPSGTNRVIVNSSGDVELTAGHLDMQNNVTIRIKDTGGTLRDILYIGADNTTCLQSGSTSKIFFKKSDGSNLMSIDSSGNVRAQGTVTGSVTP